MVSLNPVEVTRILWRFRLIGGLRRLAKEEQAAYTEMVRRNRSVWEEMLALRERDPYHCVLMHPFTNDCRPYIGTQPTDLQKEYMRILDRFWAYLDELRSVLARYKEPDSDFILLHTQVASDLIPGLEKHDHILSWMAGRKTFSDVARKLAVIHDRKTKPQLWQAH